MGKIFEEIMLELSKSGEKHQAIFKMLIKIQKFKKKENILRFMLKLLKSKWLKNIRSSERINDRNDRWPPSETMEARR